MKIRKVQAGVTFTSTGEKTIEITVNRKFKGNVGLGISTGKGEVMPFPNQGVPLGIVNRVLNKGLRGLKIESFADLGEVESLLLEYDKTPKLERLGGNTIIALEYALLRAVSNNNVWKFLSPHADEMPVPVGNCIGGGKHYNGESVDFQEFLLIPYADTFRDAAFANHHIYKKVEDELRPNTRTAKGAWVTNLDALSIFDLLKKLSSEMFEKFDIRVNLGLDVAGSHLFNGGFYFYRKGKLTRESQIKYINSLISRYGLEYIEDPLEECDMDGFGEIKCDNVVGDDPVCTNLERLEKWTGKINAVSIKPNQVGSLVKTKKLIDWAKKNNITPVMSHRAGETMDTMICDLAVAWNLPFIKCGIYGKNAFRKINRLKDIEEEIK